MNIDNPYFEGMVSQIYHAELQLNKANISDTEAPFLDLHLSILDGFVSSEIYDKRDDFDFDIVFFSFLDGDVPGTTSYGVYISQLIRFARVSSRLSSRQSSRKIVGKTEFSDQFKKIIMRYKRIGYNVAVMRQSARLVVNPITVNKFAVLFNCTPMGRGSDSMMAPT